MVCLMVEQDSFSLEIPDEFSSQNSRRLERASVIGRKTKKITKPAKNPGLISKVSTYNHPEIRLISNNFSSISSSSSVEESQLERRALKPVLSTIQYKIHEKLKLFREKLSDKQKQKMRSLNSIQPEGKLTLNQEDEVFLVKANMDSYSDSFSIIDDEEKEDYYKAKEEENTWSSKQKLNKIKNVYDSLSESEISEDEGIPEDDYHILPGSNTEFFFELIFLVGTLVSVIIVPFFLPFEYSSGFFLFLVCLSDLSQILEIVYWLNKVEVDDTEAKNYSRKAIAMSFLEKRAIFVTITAIPTFSLILQFFPFNTADLETRKYYLTAIIIFRFLKLFRADSLFVSIKISSTDLQVDKILKFIITCFIFLNISTCVWLSVGFSSNSDINWIDQKMLGTGKDGVDMYISGLFFCSVTILTVGYGDIVPVELKEYLLSVFLMIFGVGLFSFLLSSLSLLFTSRDIADIIEKKIAIIDDLRKEYEIPKNLSEKLKLFVKNNPKDTRQARIDFMTDLPISLKRELIERTLAFDFEQLDFFTSENCEFLLAAVTVIQYTSFSPKEIVYRFGEMVRQVNIIQKGTLALQLGQGCQNIAVGQVKRNETIGDIEIYFQKQIEFEVVAISRIVNTLVISAEDFFDLEKEFGSIILNTISTSIKKSEIFEVRKALIKKILNFTNEKEDLEFALELLQSNVIRESMKYSIYGEKETKTLKEHVELTLAQFTNYMELKYETKMNILESPFIIQNSIEEAKLAVKRKLDESLVDQSKRVSVALKTSLRRKTLTSKKRRTGKLFENSVQDPREMKIGNISFSSNSLQEKEPMTSREARKHDISSVSLFKVNKTEQSFKSIQVASESLTQEDRLDSILEMIANKG